MNPVGLTQAEEAVEHPRAVPSTAAKAAPGEPSCRVVVPPSGEACGGRASRRLVWPDGDATLACADCAALMVQQAEAHSARQRVDPYPTPVHDR